MLSLKFGSVVLLWIGLYVILLNVNVWIDVGSSDML